MNKIKPVEPVIEKKLVTLKGFYITPFGQRDVKIKEGNATKSEPYIIDFDKVIKQVSNAFKAFTIERENYIYSFKIYDSREHVVTSNYIDDHIKMLIDEADFVVIDWTSQNTNVLIEAGYSHGRAKPALFLTGDGSVPTDKNGILYAPYYPDRLNKIEDNLRPFIPQLVNKIEAGPRVYDYYDRRSTELISKMIKKSKTEIRILQSNLETINASHLGDLADALQRGVKVRILTLDPQSRYVNERALQLGYKRNEIGIYRDGLQTVINNTETLLRGKGSLNLKLYNDFPNQLTYIFDDNILASVISRTGRSRKNCSFVLPNGRLFGPKHTFIDHFEELWNNTGLEEELQD